MVEGLDRFKAHFSNYTDRYVLIGGTASSLAMEELGQEFRTTKDLDIVLCIETLDRDFTQAFWDFIKLGEYNNCQKSTGKRLFYRFYGPKQKGFPEMLELFARVSDALDLKESSILTPIPVDDEVSSLSAILLDDDYYTFVMQNRVLIHGLSIIKAETLIPLKAFAYLNLMNQKASGQKVQSQHIRKHKNDIYRLFTVLDTGLKLIIPKTIQVDLKIAFERLADEPTDLKLLGISRMNNAEVLAELSRF